ncbi:MAG: hypothetical protein JRI56_11595 [Deltaproteobacteria bacterium]|nr:hypothetical protein [Deltaproteobacteria bacterium]
MEATLEDIASNPRDYKICKKCGAFAWYETENCPNCNSTEFEHNAKKVEKKAIDLIDSYIEEDGYTEDEALQITTDV